MTTQIRTTQEIEHNCAGNLVRDGFRIAGVPASDGTVSWVLVAVDVVGDQTVDGKKQRGVVYCCWCAEKLPTGLDQPAPELKSIAAQGA